MNKNKFRAKKLKVIKQQRNKNKIEKKKIKLMTKK